MLMRGRGMERCRAEGAERFALSDGQPDIAAAKAQSQHCRRISESGNKNLNRNSCDRDYPSEINGRPCSSDEDHRAPRPRT
jgi:hypothetical protein